MYPFYETRKNSTSSYCNIFISQNLSFPPHLHSHIEIVYVLEGNLTVFINNRSKRMQSGEFAFSFSNDIHSYKTEDNSKVILIIFSSEIINGYFSNKSDVTLSNPYYYDNLIIDKFINMLLDEFNTNRNGFVIKGLLYSIFGKMDSQFKFEKRKYIYNNTIQILLSYIDAHYTEDLTLGILSENVGFSKFYISRLFTKKIGCQFNEYINKLRINMAQSLLKDTDLSILNIALECGFDSQRNLNRVFKNYTSLTPTEFRKIQNF